MVCTFATFMCSCVFIVIQFTDERRVLKIRIEQIKSIDSINISTLHLQLIRCFFIFDIRKINIKKQFFFNQKICKNIFSAILKWFNMIFNLLLLIKKKARQLKCKVFLQSMCSCQKVFCYLFYIGELKHLYMIE